MLLPLLLLEVAGQSASSGVPVCAKPSEDDMRPYTLCLTETRFDEAEAEMDRQLKVTLAHIETTRGARAADRLADAQLKWANRRDRKCEKQMAGTPVTQIARNTLGCRIEWTEERTAQLKALAVAEWLGRY